MLVLVGPPGAGKTTVGAAASPSALAAPASATPTPTSRPTAGTHGRRHLRRRRRGRRSGSSRSRRSPRALADARRRARARRRRGPRRRRPGRAGRRRGRTGRPSSTSACPTPPSGSGSPATGRCCSANPRAQAARAARASGARSTTRWPRSPSTPTAGRPTRSSPTCRPAARRRRPMTGPTRIAGRRRGAVRRRGRHRRARPSSALVLDGAARGGGRAPAAAAPTAAGAASRPATAGVDARRCSRCPTARRPRPSRSPRGCWDALGAAGFTRSDAVVGVGGGATTDLAGFVAATWLRGVRGRAGARPRCSAWSTPRSAARPASTPRDGKNLVGAFHPPAGVLCDLDAARDAAARRLRSRAGRGGQVRLHRRPGDPRADRGRPGRGADPARPCSRELVERAVRVKADVVGDDLRETGACARSSTTATRSATRSSRSRATAGGTARPSRSGWSSPPSWAGCAGRLDDATAARHRDRAGRARPADDATAGAVGRRCSRRCAWTRRPAGDRLRFVVLDGLGQPGRCWTDPDRRRWLEPPTRRCG